MANFTVNFHISDQKAIKYFFFICHCVGAARLCPCMQQPVAQHSKCISFSLDQKTDTERSLGSPLKDRAKQ